MPQAPAQPAEELPPASPHHAAQRQGAGKPVGKAPDAADVEASILLRAARNSVAMGDLPEAISRFAQLLEKTPRNSEARYEYAGLLMQAGRLADARRELERLVAELPEHGAYRLELADLLLRLKDYEAARGQLRALLTDKQLRPRAVIGIARAFALEHRRAEAEQFYDAHAGELVNLDPKTERDLAQLLIDLERPAEAVPILEALHREQPADESILATLMLAKVRMNARVEALEMIGALQEPALKDTGVWLDLASQLYEEQAFAESLALYRQVLEHDPKCFEAALEMARAHLRLFEVAHARQLLEKYRQDLDERDYAKVMADYHTLVGEYAEAIAIARWLLQTEPNDLQSAILLGDVYHASHQFGLAEEAYAAALAYPGADGEEERREILRLQAKNYLLARQYDQAVCILDGLLRERPTDIGNRILLIETLTEMGSYDAAMALARPPAGVEGPRSRIARETQLGYTLLKQGRWAEAERQFQSLAQPSADLSPDVAYGLFHAAQMSGQPQQAQAALATGPSPLAPPAIWGVSFAGRAMSYCDCDSAAFALDDALGQAPGNVVLLNMRGEAEQLCTCGCRQPGCACCAARLRARVCNRIACPPPADRWFCAAMQSSPTNIRARLGRARSYQQFLAYQSSYEEYCQLLRLMPQDVNLVRETARLVEDWRGLEHAAGIYAEGQAALAQENPVPTPPAPTEQPSEHAGAEPIAAGTPALSLAPSSELLCAEYEARELRGWRLHQAIPAYQRLIDMEPSNEAAMFDLSQCQSALNRTHCAIEEYERLLDANPCNRDAAVALDRNLLELQPKLMAGFDYEDQRGRQGLANMTWYNYSVSARRTRGDENEFIEVGYRERILMPTDGPADFGEIPFARWQQKYATDSLAFVEVAVEKYQYGLQTRPTFMAGIEVLNENDKMVRIYGFLKNYYMCGEAIRQDIYTTGLQIDWLWQPKRLWTLGGYYRTADLSDNNWVNWVNLNSAYLHVQGRDQIRSLIDYNFYTFAEQTVFGPIPGSLVGTIHPYWSPSGYSIINAGIEWKHWFSCHRFKGANEHFVTLFNGAAVDSNGVPYYYGTGRWQRDISARLTWTIDGNCIRSPDAVYNAVGVATYGVLRLR